MVILAVFVVGIWAVLPGVAHAADGGLIPAECLGPEAVKTCTACSFFKLIDSVFNFIFTRVIPPLAVILFAIGGFFYLVSGDSEQRRSQGRSILTWTVIGIVVAYSSFILLHTFLTVLAGDRVSVESAFLITSRSFEITCAIPSPPPPPPYGAFSPFSPAGPPPVSAAIQAGAIDFTLEMLI